jgi:hypothetical protein
MIDKTKPTGVIAKQSGGPIGLAACRCSLVMHSIGETAFGDGINVLDETTMPHCTPHILLSSRLKE